MIFSAASVSASINRLSFGPICSCDWCLQPWDIQKWLFPFFRHKDIFCSSSKEYFFCWLIWRVWNNYLGVESEANLELQPQTTLMVHRLFSMGPMCIEGLVPFDADIFLGFNRICLSIYSGSSDDYNCGMLSQCCSILSTSLLIHGFLNLYSRLL